MTPKYLISSWLTYLDASVTFFLKRKDEAIEQLEKDSRTKCNAHSINNIHKPCKILRTLKHCVPLSKYTPSFWYAKPVSTCKDAFNLQLPPLGCTGLVKCAGVAVSKNKRNLLSVKILRRNKYVRGTSVNLDSMLNVHFTPHATDKEELWQRRSAPVLPLNVWAPYIWAFLFKWLSWNRDNRM